jgi:D-alanyl-D-alanine carboxypeptidase
VDLESVQRLDHGRERAIRRRHHHDRHRRESAWPLVLAAARPVQPGPQRQHALIVRPAVTLHRIRLVLAATLIAVTGAAFVSALVAPTGARAFGELPACRYDDLLTSPRGYDDWPVTLVDPILSVPKSYAPPDLVSVSEAGLSGDGMVRALVIDDLRAMRMAASAANAPFAIESGYRSFADQQQVFAAAVKQDGYDRALTMTARPGHSEHQLGVAIDVRSPQPGSTAATFASTAAGKWLASHAWSDGFVMSYPKGLTAVTCYGGEPWHFRYVGRERAARIRASGLTLREFLWANFTTTIVPPPKTSSGPTIAPLPTLGPTPASTPDGSIAPAPSPVPGPTLAPQPSAPAATPGASEDGAVSSPVSTAAPVSDAIDPAVAAGAAPTLVLIAGVAFALIIGGGWFASRRQRPGGGSSPRR